MSTIHSLGPIPLPGLATRVSFSIYSIYFIVFVLQYSSVKIQVKPVIWCFHVGSQ